MTHPKDFKPLLAIDYDKVKTQPRHRMVSEKLDGIRCTIFGGVAYSRSLKPLPNENLQRYIKLNAHIFEGVDCEVIVGDKNAEDVFRKTTSFVMSDDKHPEEPVTLWMFDRYDEVNTFRNRFNSLSEMFYKTQHLSKLYGSMILPHYDVETEDDILRYEAEFLANGAEGIMVRDAYAQYKCGRSGTKSPELQKLKRFSEEEFLIIGYEPLMVNTNEAQTNELGRTFRSTAKEGLVAQELLGNFILETPEGLRFTSGSGLNDKTRQEYWEIRDQLVGKYAKIKFFKVGAYELPRFPVFQGIRDERDM